MITQMNTESIFNGVHITYYICISHDITTCEIPIQSTRQKASPSTATTLPKTYTDLHIYTTFALIVCVVPALQFVANELLIHRFDELHMLTLCIILYIHRIIQYIHCACSI